jgi:hypothetical protein
MAYATVQTVTFTLWGKKGLACKSKVDRTLLADQFYIGTEHEPAFVKYSTILESANLLSFPPSVSLLVFKQLKNL